MRSPFLLREAVKWDAPRVTSADCASYPILTFPEPKRPRALAKEQRREQADDDGS